MKRTMLLTVLVLGTAAGLGAQEPMTLTLDRAVAMALENNPDYRSRLNDQAVSDWRVRSAYASLLPSASIGGGLSYQEGGEARIGGFTTGDFGVESTPSYYFSSYQASLSLNLSGSKFYELGRQRAARRGVLANLDAASQTLEANVTRQYVAVLRSRDAVELAHAELERAEANLALAEARRTVESATAIEVTQAEVGRGRAEVALLQAEAALENQKTRLLEIIGSDPGRPITLTTDIPVFEPTWDVESLVRAALAAQPALDVARATEEEAAAGVGAARSAYWPSLSLSTGLGGYTRRVGSDQYLIDQAQSSVQSQRESCQALNEIFQRLDPPLPTEDCSQIRFTDEMRSQVLAQNDQFPFDFTKEPMSVSLSVSLPIFQGLSRQSQLETARAAREDASYRLRAEELRVRADVETTYRDLRTAYESVHIEERNAGLAEDQLRLARERYRLGAASFLELMEAEAVKARADRDYLLSVYTFQETLAALEAAVGQDLAIPEN